MTQMMLHCGAEPIDAAMLAQLETPPATNTHHPIAHNDVAQMVKYALGFHGHDVVEEHHAITEGGDRYFGMLQLQSPYGDYTDTVGLRNSHDKKFPIGIAFGSRVFVCDNLSFLGDQVVKRRHTPRAKRDLPGLIAEIVEPLSEQRQAQHEKFQTYRNTVLTDRDADHLIMELYRRAVINVQRIAAVAGQWQNPAHDWGDKTAWRLFNATTFALAGRLSEEPAKCARLHDVIDGTCVPA